MAAIIMFAMAGRHMFLSMVQLQWHTAINVWCFTLKY